MALLTDTITNGWPQIVQEHPKELQVYWSFREEMAVEHGLFLKATTIVIPPTMQESTLLSQHSSVDRASVLSHAVRQWHDRSQTQVPPVLVCKYVDWNGSATMLATKRSASVTPVMNLRILLHAHDKAQ